MCVPIKFLIIYMCRRESSVEAKVASKELLWTVGLYTLYVEVLSVLWLGLN